MAGLLERLVALLEAGCGCCDCNPREVGTGTKAFVEFGHPRRVWTRPGCYFKTGSQYGRVDYVSSDGPGFVRVFAKGVGKTEPADATQVHDIRGGGDGDPENAEFHEGLEKRLRRNFVPVDEDDVTEPAAKKQKTSASYAASGKLLNQLYKTDPLGASSFEEWVDTVLTDKDLLEQTGLAALLVETGPVGELLGNTAAEYEEGVVDPALKKELVAMHDARHDDLGNGLVARAEGAVEEVKKAGPELLIP